MFGTRPYKANEEELKAAAELLRRGSAEAFHVLYKAYHAKVYKFCLRMLGNEASAKDAFQETFIRVYEHRMEFRGAGFASWLFTIARHSCLNVIRTRKEHEQFDELFHSKSYEMKGDVGMSDQINKAISMLPLQLREALLLREYDELTYQEIADVLGIDLSLAKVRVFRAREILRKILKPLHKEIHES